MRIQFFILMRIQNQMQLPKNSADTDQISLVDHRTRFGIQYRRQKCNNDPPTKENMNNLFHAKSVIFSVSLISFGGQDDSLI